MRLFLALGAVSGFLAVGFGAFAAHALKGQVSADELAIYNTGAHYHLIHSLALVLVAVLIGQMPQNARALRATGWLFVIGIVVFAGSLYALAITHQKWFGAVTPLGGLCFLAGWAGLAWIAIITRP